MVSNEDKSPSMGKFELPNFTQVPNEFLDNIMRDITSLAELKVTLAIIRHTFGFHAHGGAEMSKAWLREYTGMSDNAIDEGLRRAIERGTVVVVQEADRKTSRPAAYRLNIDIPEDLLDVIRRARPGSGMAAGAVVQRGEGQKLTLGGGSKSDPGGGSKVDPGGGSEVDPGYEAQTQSWSGFEAGGNKDLNKDLSKQASIGVVFPAFEQVAVAVDEVPINIGPAVQACEQAGILFGGTIRNTVEDLLERGMEPEVVAALITEAHTRRHEMRGVGFERWAAGFIRTAYQDGVRTMEDLKAYRERAAQSKRKRGGWRPNRRPEPKKYGDLGIDWNNW